MREPELSKEVMALAERAARLCVARAPAPVVLPGLPQSDVLPAHEASILDEAGLDISGDVARGHADPAAQTVVDVMHMLSSARTVRETAHVLGVSASGVRQRIRRRSLAAICENGHYLVPRFQFAGNRLVRSFDRVYSATPPDLPLVVFYRWFVQPCPDLPTGGEAQDCNLSPRAWLVAGCNSGPVENLAALL
ncbi:MAG: hypothetical protein U5L08_07375 [Xanthomonadales bacterium]|nr:hypothetical protein [Xanthomonadales bacterium]